METGFWADLCSDGNQFRDEVADKQERWSLVWLIKIDYIYIIEVWCTIVCEKLVVIDRTSELSNILEVYTAILQLCSSMLILDYLK